VLGCRSIREIAKVQVVACLCSVLSMCLRLIFTITKPGLGMPGHSEKSWAVGTLTCCCAATYELRNRLSAHF